MLRSTIYRGKFRGQRVDIAEACATDLEGLSTRRPSGAERDELSPWMLVAIKDASRTAVHALGWRVALANTWITSPLVAANLAEGWAATYSGHVYALAGEAGSGHIPELLEHLRYALVQWGIIIECDGR